MKISSSSKKNLRIAETKLLQAQINPHFLYNTLDAIVWLAEENRKDEVVSMVTASFRLLPYNIK